MIRHNGQFAHVSPSLFANNLIPALGYRKKCEMTQTYRCTYVCVGKSLSFRYRYTLPVPVVCDGTTKEVCRKNNIHATYNVNFLYALAAYI